MDHYDNATKCEARDIYTSIAAELTGNDFRCNPQVYLGGPYGMDIYTAKKFGANWGDIYVAEKDWDHFNNLNARHGSMVKLFNGDISDMVKKYNLEGRVIYTCLDLCTTNNQESLELFNSAATEWCIPAGALAYTFQCSRDGKHSPINSLIDKWSENKEFSGAKCRALAFNEFNVNIFKPHTMIEYTSRKNPMCTVVGTAEKNTGSVFFSQEISLL